MRPIKSRINWITSVERGKRDERRRRRSDFLVKRKEKEKSRMSADNFSLGEEKKNRRERERERDPFLAFGFSTRLRFHAMEIAFPTARGFVAFRLFSRSKQTCLPRFHREIAALFRVLLGVSYTDVSASFIPDEEVEGRRNRHV